MVCASVEVIFQPSVGFFFFLGSSPGLWGANPGPAPNQGWGLGKGVVLYSIVSSSHVRLRLIMSFVVKCVRTCEFYANPCRGCYHIKTRLNI